MAGLRRALRWSVRAAAVLIPAGLVAVEGFLLAHPALVGRAVGLRPDRGANLDTRASLRRARTAFGDARDLAVVSGNPRHAAIQVVTRGDVVDGPWDGHLRGRLPWRISLMRFDRLGYPGLRRADGTVAPIVGGTPDDEPDGPAGVDVVVTGDGKVAGWGVSAGTAAAAVMARELGRRVYDLSVLGSCAPQQVAHFRRTGIALRPKVAVLVWYEGDDLPECAAVGEWQRSQAPRGIRWTDREEVARVAAAQAAIRPRPPRRREASLLGCLMRAWMDPAAMPDPFVEPPAAAHQWGNLATRTPTAVNQLPTMDEPDACGWEPVPRTHIALSSTHMWESELGYSPRGVLPARRWEEVPLLRTRPQGALNPVSMRIALQEMEVSFQIPGVLSHPRAAYDRHPGAVAAVRAIAAFAASCREAGIRPVVAWLPCKESVYWRWARETVTDAELAARVPESWSEESRLAPRATVDACRLHQRDWLAGVCRAAGVDMADTGPALESEAGRGRYVFLHHDTHPSPLGHAVIGRVLAEAIRRVASDVLPPVGGIGTRGAGTGPQPASR